MKHLEAIDFNNRVEIAGQSVVFVCQPLAMCPFCRQICPWRRGVGFDHERRCGRCDVTWEPGELYLAITSLEGK